MTHQPKPAASPGTRRALVHNAITKALSDAGDRVPLSVRIAATRAALAEIDAWHAAAPAACAHCGSSDHTWDDCEAYTRLVAEDAAAPAAVSAAVAPPTNRAAPFGSPDCTCVPFTRKEGMPRACGPDDTVDDISGWETGRDCPHHAPVAPPTDPTHGLSVPHADALWDAVAIPGPRTPTYPEQHERVCRAVRDILAELTPARGETADRAALRDRIRLAIARQWLDEMGSDRTADELDDAEFGSFADAVLAELPSAADWDDLVREADRLRRDGTALHARAEELDTQLTALRQQVTEPTDRAAVSREAEAELYVLLRKAGEPRDEAQALIDRHRDEVLRRAALRRMADETATQTPEEQ